MDKRGSGRNVKQQEKKDLKTAEKKVKKRKRSQKAEMMFACDDISLCYYC